MDDRQLRRAIPERWARDGLRRHAPRVTAVRWRRAQRATLQRDMEVDRELLDACERDGSVASAWPFHVIRFRSWARRALWRQRRRGARRHVGVGRASLDPNALCNRASSARWTLHGLRLEPWTDSHVRGRHMGRAHVDIGAERHVGMERTAVGASNAHVSTTVTIGARHGLAWSNQSRCAVWRPYDL